MKDNFDRATERARRCMRATLKDGVPPVVAADAFITQALAVWAAETGRHQDAKSMLAAFTILRDAA